MKLRIVRFITFLSFISIIVLQQSSAYAAGSASFSISPSSGSFTKGTNFTISVNENSGNETVNAVEADLSYDQTKLQFVSVDASTSNFDFPASTTGGNGSIQIARGVSGGGSISGDKRVANIVFTVINSGSTTISIKNGSAIVRDSDAQDIWNGLNTPANFTLIEPAPKPVTQPNPAPTTSTPTTQSKKTVAIASTTTPVVPDDQPIPTTTVVSNDGYLVAVQLFDKKGQAITKTTVTLDGKKSVTDDKGIAGFPSVTAGSHTIKSGSASKTITVKQNSSSEVQIFNLTANRSYRFTLKQVIIGFIILLVILFIYGYLSRIKVKKIANLHIPQQTETLKSATQLHNQEPATVIHPNEPIDKL